MFGTDEPLKKPVPLHEQTVKDEKGRYQRFHGAFTGGFSAGYYNTVGTKEGKVNTKEGGCTIILDKTFMGQKCNIFFVLDNVIKLIN